MGELPYRFKRIRGDDSWQVLVNDEVMGSVFQYLGAWHIDTYDPRKRWRTRARAAEALVEMSAHRATLSGSSEGQS